MWTRQRGLPCPLMLTAGCCPTGKWSEGFPEERHRAGNTVGQELTGQGEGKESVLGTGEQEFRPAFKPQASVSSSA